MLTVKLVEDNGHEQIHEVESVSADPIPNSHCHEVSGFRTDEHPLNFGATEGYLYVMNEDGKTISRYRLQREALPQ
jgi:hypothetical protein